MLRKFVPYFSKPYKKLIFFLQISTHGKNFFINTSIFSVFTNNVIIIIVSKLRRRFFFEIWSNSRCFDAMQSGTENEICWTKSKNTFVLHFSYFFSDNICGIS